MSEEGGRGVPQSPSWCPPIPGGPTGQTYQHRFQSVDGLSSIESRRAGYAGRAQAALQGGVFHGEEQLADKSGGTLDKAFGRFKEASGALTGNEGRKARGQGKQAKGSARKRKGHVKDLFKRG